VRSSFFAPHACGSGMCLAFEPCRHIFWPVTHATAHFHVGERIAARTAPCGERAIRQAKGGRYLIGREQISGAGWKGGDGLERCRSHLAFPVVVERFRANAKGVKGNERRFTSLFR
jgi:hypothetical protein